VLNMGRGVIVFDGMRITLDVRRVTLGGKSYCG
jgi:hypothetical protein